jgi:hypothetical protein
MATKRTTKPYSYRVVLPNGKTTGQALLETLSNSLGNDYSTWHKDPKYVDILRWCHVFIFGRPVSAFKPGGGLRLRIAFLEQAIRQTKGTKNKRQCYNDVAIDALAAGVISVETYHILRK